MAFDERAADAVLLVHRDGHPEIELVDELVSDAKRGGEHARADGAGDVTPVLRGGLDLLWSGRASGVSDSGSYSMLTRNPALMLPIVR